MKGLVATTAVLGVLAIGGLPALALTLAADETERAEEPSTTLAEGPPDAPGPPPWAQGENRQPPPGWVRNHGGARPHGWAVREWAHCRADAARSGQAGGPGGPEVDCGPKPAPPEKAARGQDNAEKGKSSKDRAEKDWGEKGKPGKSKKPRS